MELNQRKARKAGLNILCLALGLLPLMAGATGLRYIETASGSRSNDTLEIIRWTHARLVFEKELLRIAVGRSGILEVELLGGKEALMLGKSIGKTSLIVWYTDGSTEPLVFGVVEDLAVLRGVLRDIHRNVRIELAPDRAALILRGTVPTVEIKTNAESAAKSYLSADGSGTAQIYNPDSTGTQSDAMPKTAIINLIKTEEVVQTTEEKMLAAIASISEGVSVRRVMKGNVRNDADDTFILEGEVKNQVALTRVLSLASSILVGNGSPSIDVISDEGGGLSSNTGVSVNVARAKMLSVAGGRLLSMIHVRYIPQVRVAVQIHEVNRNRLKEFTTDMSLTATDSETNPLGGEDTEITNALELISGTFTNNFQLASSDVAFDMLFSMLEEEGISRVLSSPTITVLSGERATFEVGGQIPVPSTFSPSGSLGNEAAPGTYSNVEFKKYGINLEVYPLVDENNVITLEVSPEISQPDIALTKKITDSTGTSSSTTAFNVRSITTSMQVRDGQPLVIGGLISHTGSNSESYVPGLNQVPVAGLLGRGTGKTDNSTELVIIVTSTIVQKPNDQIALWQYPGLEVLLDGAVGIPEYDLEIDDIPSWMTSGRNDRTESNR